MSQKWYLSNWVTTSFPHLNTEWTCKIWFVWHCRQRLEHFKAGVRFLKGQHNKDLGFDEISAAGCDQVNIFSSLCWGHVSACVSGTYLPQKEVTFPTAFLPLPSFCFTGDLTQLCLHWWQALSQDVCGRCLIFLERFCLLVDDHDCTKKLLHIYCTSQKIVFSLPNSGFLLYNEKNLFYMLCFYFKNINCCEECQTIGQGHAFFKESQYICL